MTGATPHDGPAQGGLAPIAVRADPPEELELPAVHLELAWRPLRADDAGALYALVEAVESADAAAERHSADEVAAMLTGSWKDLERDTLAGFDDAGTMRAYAMVDVRPGDTRTVRATLTGGVHPRWRGRGVGRAVLVWMEGRGRQKLAESGKELPARLGAYLDEAARDQRRLYAAAGFRPVRWYTGMRRDLGVPLPEVEPPAGVRIVPWSEELDELVRLAHNETFADHWGSEPHTAEAWRHHDAHFVPSWSFVALDESSGRTEVAGYLVSGRYEQSWAAVGYTSGWTDLLGVRRAWRRRGLASALLTTAMAAYRADGMQYAGLAVDTENPSGAHGFYAALGYEVRDGVVLYSVEL